MDDVEAVGFLFLFKSRALVMWFRIVLCVLLPSFIYIYIYTIVYLRRCLWDNIRVRNATDVIVFGTFIFHFEKLYIYVICILYIFNPFYLS